MNSGNAGGNSNGSGVPETLTCDNEALARCLVDARLQARVLKEFPGQLPTTLEQAYCIQAASVARWPDEVAGWKVARLPTVERERFAQERLAGPIYRSMVQSVEAEATSVAHIFDGGFAAVEAEIILELGSDVPPDFNANKEDLAALIAKAYCGAEIASSPMPFVIDLGAMSIISDMGINVGAIVGPEIDDFLARPAGALTVTATVDGDVVGAANSGAITGTPFEALQFLVEHCHANNIALHKGDLISTGMITGVHAIRVGSRARLDFGKHGWFDVLFEQISPQEPAT